MKTSPEWSCGIVDEPVKTNKMRVNDTFSRAIPRVEAIGHIL
jgi:hypothetical protein